MPDPFEAMQYDGQQFIAALGDVFETLVAYTSQKRQQYLDAGWTQENAEEMAMSQYRIMCLSFEQALRHPEPDIAVGS